MLAQIDPIVRLVDEVARLRGRFKELFAPIHDQFGLSEIEMAVLNAVIEAAHPPTVPRIGRSLGHPRQVIQRAVNTLTAAGLLRPVANPDHKRAPLLTATEAAAALKAQADQAALALLGPIVEGIPQARLVAAIALLHDLRGAIERSRREAPQGMSR